MGSVEESPVYKSAIADHLQQPRTCPIKRPDGHAPPFPCYVARFPQSVKDLVMAIIGAQHANAQVAKEARALDKILSFMNQGQKTNSEPRVKDIASVTDNTGAYNEVVIAYWDNIPAFEAWTETSCFGAWWKSLDPAVEKHGWFQEVFLPSVDRYENIYANKMEGWTPEGAGAYYSGMSGMIKEHGYWGSMRDRIAVSQVDKLASGPDESSSSSSSSVSPGEDTTKARIHVPGKHNLAVIRSGQDWTKTLSDEHKLYTETLHPVMTEGMNFLRDEGAGIGCYSCRFMDILDSATPQEPGMNTTKKTFGLAYFDNLASLEKWSKEHPTHLKIFGGFLQYVKKLDFHITLHLYHEVTVLKADQQIFEYIGCHEGTGMLRTRRS